MIRYNCAMNRKAQYKPQEIEVKWQKYWEENKTFSPDLKNAKNPYYTLMMFPYPSAEGLHVGNMYAFTGADIHGRYMRMKGKDVFEPIGLDGFGIHSENYALAVGRHPREQAKISEKNFYRQLRATGNAYDWTRTLETYDPDYYRWTQWIFVQMFKKGLAYRKKARVNWCPSDKTVLADEQVIDGRCERCSSVVEKRDLEQWFFKITAYADALLNGLNQIDWPEKIKIAQRQWIGKSEGSRIKFKVQNSKLKIKEIEVFTTRADTLFGATFLVLAPEHPISTSIRDKFVQQYIEKAKKKSDKERIENKEKTGVFSGLYGINPVNKEKIPIWIADYAVMGYGTGALFGDAHDERDTEFAKKYGIRLKPTLHTGDKKKDKRIDSLEECFTGDGVLFDSGEFSGLSSAEAKKKIAQWLERYRAGGPETTYHLRDWLISRQRYGGPPIPIIYCRKCWGNSKLKTQNSKLIEGRDYAIIDGREHMIRAVPEEQLPVELPDVKDWRPEGTGTSPLANHPEFYQTKCPSCNSSAKRETDVSDTFLDSSWYYLRYLSIQNQEARIKKQGTSSKDIKSDQPLEIGNLKLDIPYDLKIVRRWCPIAIYIGGAEHSVLHLLYVRFIAMVLHDLNLDDRLSIIDNRSKINIQNLRSKIHDLALPFAEPFPRFFAHGLIISEGAKMSKSRGNIVVPDIYIEKFGADTLRLYLMFLGPFSQGGDFRDTGIEGMHRFVRRVWNLFTTKEFGEDNQDTLQMINKTIKKVTLDIEEFSYNTAIARLMEFYNFISDNNKSWSQQTARSYLRLFAPFAPHLAEEVWQEMKHEARSKNQGEINHDSKFMIRDSIHFSEWPKYDEKYLVQEKVTVVVQVNGKRRGEVTIDSSNIGKKNEVESLARKEVEKYVAGKSVKNVIYIPGRIINFVI